MLAMARPLQQVDMPKVEISEELLRLVADEIGRVAELYPAGSVERREIDVILSRDATMMDAFIRMNLRGSKAEDG